MKKVYKKTRHRILALLMAIALCLGCVSGVPVQAESGVDTQQVSTEIQTSDGDGKKESEQEIPSENNEEKQQDTTVQETEKNEDIPSVSEEPGVSSEAEVPEDEKSKVDNTSLGEEAAAVAEPQYKNLKDNQFFVEDDGWLCQYTDDTKSKVYVVAFLIGAVNAKNWISDMQETLPDFPDTYKSQVVIPATVMYNGVEYPVVGVGEPEKNGSGFKVSTRTNPDDIGDILHVSKIIVSEGIERIENVIFSDSIMDRLEELVLPNTITYVGSEAIRNCERLKTIALPSSVKEYGEGALSQNFFDELIFPESDTPCVIKDGVGVYSLEATRIELPKNIVSVGEDCFYGSYKLQTFSMWNTTTFPHQNAMDFTGCGAGSTEAANSGTKGTGNYILKSEKALDLTKDETYLTLKNGIEPGSTQQLVYGIVTINSTDPEKFEMEKGSAKELHITVEAKTGNDKVDITKEYAPDWVDTGYTWTLEGNTSTDTIMDGDTVRIGKDETADKITITATSVYDENKKVSFEITPVKATQKKATQKKICQIIKGSTYDETTGTYGGGVYVDKYSTLQDAIASLSGDGDEVIEMLVDYEIPTSDVATITDKKCSITTAPKSGHTAGNNSKGEEPGVYTGTGTSATIKRATDKTGEVFYLSGSTECTISNLTIDGANINASRALILAKDTSVLNLFVGTTLENGKCTGYTGYTEDQKLSGRGGAVNSQGSTTNITEGVAIKNNSSQLGGGMYVYAGTVTMTGGIFENNQVTALDSHEIGESGRGGGIAMHFSTFNLSGGCIENNTAEKHGGGIYVDGRVGITNVDGTTKNVICVSGNPRIINNKGEGATENLYLEEGIYVDVMDELLDSAYIGVSASGQDTRKMNRMQETGIFGYVRGSYDKGTIASYRKSLEHFVNDQDSNLYGFDAGLIESYGRGVQWMPKSDYNEYVCKIKDQGYYTINDAFVDIARNKEDSQNPTDSKAIPEGNVYKIEMLVEEHTLERGVILPTNKQIILTTAQENASGIVGELDYRGSVGTHCAIKRGEWMRFQPLIYCDNVSTSLTLKNIIFDGQGGNSWKDEQGNTIVGKGNIAASAEMLALRCHKLVLDEGTIFQNSKSSASTIEVIFDEKNASSYQKAEVIMKGGSIIRGNSATTGSVRSTGIEVRELGAHLIIEEGAIIRDNSSVADSFTGAVHADQAHIKMLGGEITENLNMSGVFIENDVSSSLEYRKGLGSFDMKGGIISKNTGTFFGGGGVTMFGGDFNMSGGSIVGNKTTGLMGQGGGVFCIFEQPNMTITGGKIVGNTAPISGGGIYVMSSEYPVTISGTAQVYGNAVGETAEPNDKGEAVLGDKGSKNNVHLANDAWITVGGKLEDTAKIGITAEGEDETAKDRMTSGARFGVNSDNAQDVLDSLDHFFRDTNGTAADGIRLYGADGGMLDEGNLEEEVAPTYKVVWEPKQFTLTFDANGGDGTMKEILHDGETPLNLEGNAFTYPGHKFLGWNTEADGSGDAVEDKKQGYEPGMKDITLYAQWESTNNALTVSNVVVDAPEEFSEDFDYKLTVKVPTGSASPTSIDCINSGDLGATSITLDANGEGKFSLKPGANIILQIPRDATYIIEQTKKNEYQTVNAVNGGTQSNSLTTGEISMDRADSSVVFTNTKLYTLTLHKAMTGDFIDSTREFAFDVTITYADETTKTEKLTLKKDGSVSLTSPLLRGTKVTITEAAASGYSTSYVVNGDDANKIQGRILTDLLIDGDKDVVCTNHSEIAITGVDTGSSNHLPIILAGAFLILLLMSGTILRFRYLRKKGEDING